MARVKYGAIVTDISGSVGGSTFQRNKSGATFRNKPNPLKSSSITQIQRRAIMRGLQNSWSELTEAQRSTWNMFIQYSRQTTIHNKSVFISGYNLFLKYQYCRILNNQVLLETFLYVPMNVNNGNRYISTNGTHLYLSFDIGLVGEGTSFMYSLSRPERTTTRFNASKVRFMLPVILDDYNFDITDSYLAQFGQLPPLGSYLHYQIYWYSPYCPIVSAPESGPVLVEEW